MLVRGHLSPDFVRVASIAVVTNASQPPRAWFSARL